MTENIVSLTQKIKELELELKRFKNNQGYGIKREGKAEEFEARAKDALPILQEQAKMRIDNKHHLDHLIIEGDNYHSLSALSYTHKGVIDVIYIDPPYNTGNKDFIYNDHYVDKEDSYRHSKWLSFMNKRLKLAKDILSERGAIFISIDDNEFAQLKLLCDEIFGEKNFVDCISWEKKSSAKGVPPVNMIVNTHEYVLVYQKSDSFSFIGEPRDINGFSNPDDDPRGPRRNTNIKSTVKSKDQVFDIIDPRTGNIFTDTRAFSKIELERLIKEDYLIFPKNKNGQVRKKEFYNEFKNSNTPIRSSWGLFDNQKNTEMLKSMFGGLVFTNPKPLNLLYYLLKVVSKSGDTILDFFAGSGTTGHAVLELNKEDGGNRQFILCSSKEATKEESDKNICRDVTYERVKKVIQGYTNAQGEHIPPLGGGNLRYYNTEFIKITKATDDLRHRFINLCDDLLCIKEDTFDVVKTKQSSEYLKLFTKGDRYTAILYDIHHFDELLELLKKAEGKVAVYIFSLSKEIYEEEIAYLDKDITIQNIPDDILQTYKKIFNF